MTSHRTTLVLLLAALAGPASAEGLSLALQDPLPIVPTERTPVLVANETWGTINPSSLILRSAVPILSDADHVADVIFDNHLTTGNVTVKAATLRIDGLVVHATIVHGAERVPDVLRVEPPVGFVARPPAVTVEDGTVGLIEIHRVPVS